MPPMYMVVDIRWDDYAPEDEIVQMQDPTKDIFQNNIALPISPSRKRWALLRKSKQKSQTYRQVVPEPQFAQDPPKILSG